MKVRLFVKVRVFNLFPHIIETVSGNCLSVSEVSNQLIDGSSINQ